MSAAGSASHRRTGTAVPGHCQDGNLGTTPLSGAAIHKTIRRRGERAGYDAALVSQLGGHSLRAGFVTQAFRNGADAHAIMRQTGHTTRYARTLRTGERAADR